MTKNEIIVEHNAIKREFYNYYANLFKEKEVKKEDLEKYFNTINIPKISEYMSKKLNEPITTEEVEKAIDEMKNGKSPVYIWYILTIARIQYAKYWRQNKIPTIEKW